MSWESETDEIARRGEMALQQVGEVVRCVGSVTQRRNQMRQMGRLGLAGG